jgi:hypothetical protein
LHSQKKKRNPCNKNALCWSFFVCEMTMQMWYMMHPKSCIVCCVIPIMCFPLTQKWN